MSTSPVLNVPPRITSKNLDNSMVPWCLAIHDMAKEKGWWPGGLESRNLREMLLLIKSELVEAFEEYRKPDIKITDVYHGDSGKPEGFPIEIADAVIRIFDLVGASFVLSSNTMDFRVASAEALRKADLEENHVPKNIGEAIDTAVVMVGNCLTFNSIVDGLLPVVGYLFRLCSFHEIDLGVAIETKFVYNATRAFRHGNKRA
jgi:hypothetical protein